MAARKTGLGRGIDGLFPVYNTDKAGSKKQSDDKQGRRTASNKLRDRRLVYLLPEVR